MSAQPGHEAAGYRYARLPLSERSADELLKLHRATLAEVRRLEDEEHRYAGYSHVPYRIRGELMYQREMLERYRAWGVAARTREIRALAIRAGIFTHTIPTSLEYARTRARHKDAA